MDLALKPGAALQDVAMQVGRLQAQAAERTRHAIGGVFADDHERAVAIARLNRRAFLRREKRIHTPPRGAKTRKLRS